MDDFLSTPVVRPGPTSRLLRRQSGLPEPRNPKETNTIIYKLDSFNYNTRNPNQTVYTGIKKLKKK